MSDESMDCDDVKAGSTSPKDAESAAPSLVREGTLECAICLQPFIQPVQLPCSHTFCFLCAKGIALQRRPCALCRSVIPQSFLSSPGLFLADESKLKVEKSSADSDRHVWYYQGNRGWWQYDDRTSREIEDAYSKREKSVDILITGTIYVIDFENMIQYQRNNMNSRKRKIKRDQVSAEKKGVAGMFSTPAPRGSTNQAQTAATSRPRQVPVGASNDDDSSSD